MRDANAAEQECLFCQAPSWRWLYLLQPPPADAAVALPAFVVTCGPCHDRWINGQSQPLLADLANTTTEDVMISFGLMATTPPLPRT